MGERIVFSTNGTRTTEYPHAEEWICTPSSHHEQKLTWNEPQT